MRFDGRGDHLVDLQVRHSAKEEEKRNLQQELTRLLEQKEALTQRKDAIMQEIQDLDVRARAAMLTQAEY